jgi:hypothetical protein
MKKAVRISLCLAALAPAAAALEVPSLPEPLYADGEAVLDVPLGPGFAAVEGGTFRLTLAFEGSASNNVQFALGRDGPPAAGRLDASDTAFLAGRDRGAHFLRPRGLAERLEAPDAAGPGPKTLVFQARRTASGGLTNAALTVSGQGAAFAFPSAPEWLGPSGWDTLRVTSRGTGSPAASVTVKRFKDGAAVILK